MTGPAGTAALTAAFKLIRAAVDHDDEAMAAMRQATCDEQVVVMVALADIAAVLIETRAEQLGMSPREQVDLLEAGVIGQHGKPNPEAGQAEHRAAGQRRPRRRRGK